MSKRVCSEPGCPELTNGRRCVECARAHDRARGQRQARGYDKRHYAKRKRLAPLVATGTVRCWRCGEYIQQGQAWDLGHDDHDRSKHRGPEHAGPCNRAAGGRAAHEG